CSRAERELGSGSGWGWRSRGPEGKEGRSCIWAPMVADRVVVSGVRSFAASWLSEECCRPRLMEIVVGSLFVALGSGLEGDVLLSTKARRASLNRAQAAQAVVALEPHPAQPGIPTGCQLPNCTCTHHLAESPDFRLLKAQLADAAALSLSAA